MEDFGYLRYEEQSKISAIVKKALIIGAVIFSAFCFIYITINAYYFVYHEENSNIKIIKSPESPIKIKPDNNDNIAIKDMGRAVYENIVGGKKESLKDVHIIKTPKNSAALLNKSNNKTKKAVAKHSTIISQDSYFLTSEDLEEITTYDIAENSKNIKPSQSDDITDITYQDTDLNKAGRPISRVQIAAMSSHKSAQQYWQELKKKYSKLFSSNLKPFIKRVDLGKKGVFYRLQIGNFSNQIEAENFCIEFINKAQKNKVDCIIVE